MGESPLLPDAAEEDWERVQQHILPAMLREGRWEGEIRFRHLQTGAPMPMLQHAFCIKGPDSDRSIAMATISRNITRRKQAETALARRAAQLKGLAEAAAVVSAATSLGDILQSVADRARDIIGAHKCVIEASANQKGAPASQAVSLSDTYAVY